MHKGLIVQLCHMGSDLLSIIHYHTPPGSLSDSRVMGSLLMLLHTLCTPGMIDSLYGQIFDIQMVMDICGYISLPQLLPYM